MSSPESLTVQKSTAPARDALRHTQTVPQGDFRFIALDVETACGDQASICQIGIACVEEDNSIQTFSMLIDPQMRFSGFNVQLHGIGPEHVVGAPYFAEALAVILRLLSKYQIFQHSNFDRRAMAAACERAGIETPDLRWSDSVPIARRAWPELKGNGGHGLASLKRKLDLAFEHHDAGEDARAAALVVLHAEQQLGLPFDKLAMLQTAKRPAFQKKPVPAPNPDGPLFGTLVVFSGKLGVSRHVAAEMATRVGMTVETRISSKTTWLVVGGPDTPLFRNSAKSSKYRQAKELTEAGHPIRIINESTFREILNSPA